MTARRYDATDDKKEEIVISRTEGVTDITSGVHGVTFAETKTSSSSESKEEKK